MRYSPNIYAKAFLSATHGLHESGREEAIKRFISLVERSGDGKHFAKIVRAIERAFIKKSGKRFVTLETARPQSASALGHLKKLFSESDHLEEKINPSLIAGARITINDELEFDLSLKRRLDLMLG